MRVGVVSSLAAGLHGLQALPEQVEPSGERTRLSAINSGATLYPGAPERGPFTFRTIEDYPYTERRRRRTPQTAVVELAVLGGVPDLADHVVSVQRRLGAVVIADEFRQNVRDQRGSR